MSDMLRVVMSAMGCDRRAHYGNVTQPFCGKHGHYGKWPCPDAEVVAAALTAAGFGLVKAAAAGALMEAADRLEKSAQNCVLTWGSEPMSALASASVSAINHDARRLRARAAELRQP